MPSFIAPPPCPAPAPATGALQRSRPQSAGGDRGSLLLAWTALALIVVVGVPLFLCLPFWFDVYHYDVCARTLLRGGVLYRDVFDNNLPGVVWLQAGLRTLFGWRPIGLHLADLIFFTVDVLLLVRWVRPGERRSAAPVWTAAALFAFYLFAPESCSCQRDIWMLLPALIGLTLRRRQVRRLSSPAHAPAVVGRAALEGLVWGSAVWIKPFVFVPALACWLVGVAEVRRAGPGKARPLAADLAGLLLGGVVAGALGLAWLWQSGSWPYFWNIVLEWNKDYAAYSHRLDIWYISLASFLILYVPWSIVPFVAVGLAVKALRRELTAGRAVSSAPARPGVAPLAAFYLGWLFQALFLQLPHDYALVPAMMPAIALVGALYRPPARSSLIGASFRIAGVALAALLWTVAFHLDRVQAWPRCLREGATPQVQSLLATRKENPYCVDAAPLAKVADYLRGQGVGDGELTCLSGCTHGLYLDLGVRPSTRFPQVEMTTLFFVHHREAVLAELNASRQRFVVSDLVWTGLTPAEAEEEDPNDPLALPPRFPEEFVGAYPWREPVVFRSGRYLVHRVTGPASVFWRDDTEILSEGKYKTRYAEFFAGRLSYSDEAAARESVALIDELYRRSGTAYDRAGQHQALRAALTMFDEARLRGKDREAEAFRRWLEGKMDGGATTAGR